MKPIDTQLDTELDNWAFAVNPDEVAPKLMLCLQILLKEVNLDNH